MEANYCRFRNLDDTNSSMDIASLNNLVVSMRKGVKGAKIHILNKLTRILKDMKKKKGNEEQQKKLEKKTERITKEMEFIKHVKPDKVSKFALAKTEKYEEICRKHPDSIENRALARLSENKYISDKVKSFRNSHEDWKELAAFILSKNTGRRFKVNKGTGVQREVEQVLLESQRELQKRENSDDSSAESESSTEHASHPEQLKADSEQHESESEGETTVQTTSKSTSNKSSDEKTEKQKNKIISSSIGFKDVNSETVSDVCPSSNKGSEERANTHREKESAIKRLNLDELKDGDVIVVDEAPSFLQSRPVDIVSNRKKKAKSKFFMCDSDSDEDAESGGDAQDGEQAEDSDDAEKEEEMREKNKARAKEAINSTFLGSLSSAGRKQIEKRENWRFGDYKRQEKPQNWQSSQRAPFSMARKPNMDKTSMHRRKDNSSQIAKVKTDKMPASVADQELHPSWEASRKRKQLQSQIQPFQGKKIRFDDD